MKPPHLVTETKVVLQMEGKRTNSGVQFQFSRRTITDMIVLILPKASYLRVSRDL